MCLHIRYVGPRINRTDPKNPTQAWRLKPSGSRNYPAVPHQGPKWTLLGVSLYGG